MLVVLGLLGLTAILEIGLGDVPGWRVRRALAALIALLLAASSLDLLLMWPNAATLLILAMSVYRIVNLARLVWARRNERYLQSATLRTSVWIIGMQVLVLMAWDAVWWWQIGMEAVLTAAMLAIFGGSLVLLMSTMQHVRTTRPPALPEVGLSAHDLPTLTVAIPARNETDDLEACLSSLIASDYPKLEILVLDDCSQSRRTPEIIRSYAHAGVRFIEGNPPSEDWLAKNQAYQQLLEASNGKLVLFSGVDVRFTPGSLRQLVLSMLHKHKSMMSIIPKNHTPSAPWTHRDPLLIQPMRYAWEFALPRRLFGRTPVLSTCWIARREMLERAGGFRAVSRSIVPESYFARVSAATDDGYSFMQSNEAIGISCIKRFEDQRQTAVRMRYPQLHRRMELVMIVTMIELFGIGMPTLLVVMSALEGSLLLSGAGAIITIGVLAFTYAQIVVLTYRRRLPRAVLVLPFATVLDVVLLNYSMIRYEFFGVIWKGRNVCIPLMRVVDKLPPA